MSSINSVEDVSQIIGYAYVGLYVVLLMLIIVLHYDPKQKFSKNVSKIWKKRRIYGVLLVQVFDQASDISVAILWGFIAFSADNDKDFNISTDYIDMKLMFGLSLFSILLARIVNSIVAWRSLKNGTFLDAILAFFEFYTIKQLWIIHSNSLTTPTIELQTVQLYEAIFESFLQIIFQSLFIIRTFDSSSEFADYFLIIFSIFWSMMSAANKYSVIDTSLSFDSNETGNFSFKSSNCKTNIYYIIRNLWRISNIMQRLCMLTLLWAVCGVSFLFLFIFVTFLCYYFVYLKQYLVLNDSNSNNNNNNSISSKSFVNKLEHALLYYFVCHLVGIIWAGDTSKEKPFVHIIHQLIENLVAMILIGIFITIKFDCPLDLCVEFEIRNIDDNYYVFTFSLIMIVLFVISPTMFCFLSNKTLTKYELKQQNKLAARNEHERKENGLSNGQKRIQAIANGILYQTGDSMHAMHEMKQNEKLRNVIASNILYKVKKNDDKVDKREIEMDIDMETGFGNDLASDDVAFNPIANGILYQTNQNNIANAR